MSLRNLEERSDIYRHIICRIESGRANTTIDTINALAMGLGKLSTSINLYPNILQQPGFIGWAVFFAIIGATNQIISLFTHKNNAKT